VLSFPTGRDRIARVARGPATTAGKVPFAVTRNRLHGYRAAARACGHPWSEVLVAVCPRNSAEDAERAATAVLGGPERPDAIAAMSDQLAAGVLRAAANLGIQVPDQLAVTGWDDDRVATELGLTTVAQSLREQGATCAEIVLGRSPAPDAPAAWKIVHRTSTRHLAP
jgi:DNA-binding LacI/PurR family transcriptional regulator